MMKKWLCFAVSVMLVLAGMAFAAAESTPAPDGSAPEPVTAQELGEWAAAVKALALESESANDPADEASDTENGVLFLYSFGALYADGPEMTADTGINVISVSEAAVEDIIPRGLHISMTPGEVSALFPCDNPEMAGDRYAALLYIRETGDDSVAYGRVYRDGQRISALEYGELVPAGDGYRVVSLVCGFAEGLLFEVRGEGLNDQSAAVLTAADRDTFIAELKDLDLLDEYSAVKTSRNGAELDEFGKADLAFSGIDLLKVKPDELPEPFVQDLFDNEDGTWLMTVTGEDYEAVFRCEKDGGNAEIVSFTITGEEMEGPRGVRLGDVFHEDLQRFRFEGRGSEDGTSEVLYGEDGKVPQGTVQYVGDDGMTVQYVAEADGKTVTLMMRYSFNVLSEIILMVE